MRDSYKLPGASLKHCVLSPEAIRTHGVADAFDEAMRRLRIEFVRAVQRDRDGAATYHIALTQEQP